MRVNGYGGAGGAGGFPRDPDDGDSNKAHNAGSTDDSAHDGTSIFGWVMETAAMQNRLLEQLEQTRRQAAALLRQDRTDGEDDAPPAGIFDATCEDPDNDYSATPTFDMADIFGTDNGAASDPGIDWLAEEREDQWLNED
jgi:hypothetical protein